MLFMSPKDELDDIHKQLARYTYCYGEVILTTEFTPEDAQAELRVIYRKLGAVPPMTKPKDELVTQKLNWERIHQLVTRRQELLFGW